MRQSDKYIGATRCPVCGSPLTESTRFSQKQECGPAGKGMLFCKNCDDVWVDPETGTATVGLDETRAYLKEKASKPKEEEVPEYIRQMLGME